MKANLVFIKRHYQITRLKGLFFNLVLEIKLKVYENWLILVHGRSLICVITRQITVYFLEFHLNNNN